MISEALGLKPLMGEEKQKLLSTLIVSLGALLGFEALSYFLEIYQIEAYLKASFYIYFFHIFWLTFLFDLHFKKKPVLANFKFSDRSWKLLGQALKERTEHIFTWRYIRHYQNYLLLPAMLYWSIVVLLFLNPFRPILKQIIIILGTLCMTTAYWYMKEMFSRRMEATEHGLKILGLVKILAGFFIYAATFGVTRYFGFDQTFLFSAIFTLTFLLLYQALFQHKLVTSAILIRVVGIAGIVSLTSLWVYFNWDTNYITGGLVILSVYNALWGFLHHHLDKTLNRKLVMEYSLMLLLALSLLLASHDFGARVG